MIDFQYSPEKHGIVIAVRIYNSNNIYLDPRAELVLAFDNRHVDIGWTNVKEREMFMPGINGYTLFFDERPKGNFYEMHFKRSSCDQTQPPV